MQNDCLSQASLPGEEILETVEDAQTKRIRAAVSSVCNAESETGDAIAACQREPLGPACRQDACKCSTRQISVDV